MSKKKEINLKSTPAAVESGDVNITYNNVLVGSLSDSGSAVLKTEMTICEHDIELEYTKPASGVDLPDISINAPEGFNSRLYCNILMDTDVNNNYLAVDTRNMSYPFNGKYIPSFEYNGYSFSLRFPDADRIYNAYVNNNPMTYEEGEWSDTVRDSNYSKPVTVTIELRN